MHFPRWPQTIILDDTWLPCFQIELNFLRSPFSIQESQRFAIIFFVINCLPAHICLWKNDSLFIWSGLVFGCRSDDSQTAENLKNRTAKHWCLCLCTWKSGSRSSNPFRSRNLFSLNIRLVCNRNHVCFVAIVGAQYTWYGNEMQEILNTERHRYE